MLVLGIYGSPRKEGNTDLMLDAFLDGAMSAGASVHRLYTRDMEIRGCLECGYCDKKGECITKDDMVGVYPLLEQTPRIVTAAPIFFYGVPAQLKLLIDRSQALFMKRELARKSGGKTGEVLEEKDRKGFLLSAGATGGKRLFDCAILTVKYFMDALQMTYAGEICVPRIDEKGAIRLHSAVLGECRAAGERFVEG